MGAEALHQQPEHRMPLLNRSLSLLLKIDHVDPISVKVEVNPAVRLEPALCGEDARTEKILLRNSHTHKKLHLESRCLTLSLSR